MSEAEEVAPGLRRAQPPNIGPLPEAVRSRVVALTADALAVMPSDHLPPALRRVASFAPARRAKLAGNQIASLVGSDEDFREHLAVQVRARVPVLAAALDKGEHPAAADPVEMAAVAYLLRPTGWESAVSAAADAAGAERAASAGRREADETDRVRRQLGAVTEDLRRAREKSRDQAAALKGENAELRRKLGEARTRLKAAESEAGRATAGASDAEAASGVAAAAADAEIRRLRGRLEEAEQEIAAARRTERAGRDAEALRARLLLDTLLDSAKGLRRELALPAVVEGAPADQVEARAVEPGRTTSTTGTGRRSRTPDDPALLDELLCLPRAHMIVDGYNVTKNAWPDSSLEIQRDRLLAGVAPLAARSGAEVTVVFDAAEAADRPVVRKPRGVRVLFSENGVIADDLIRELVAVEPQGRAVVVVTSDQEIVRDVRRAGFRVVASAALSALLARG